jgi:hypothetical protein
MQLAELFKKSSPTRALFINFSKHGKQEELAKQLSNHELVFADWSELSIVNGVVHVQEQPIDAFEFIFVGVVGKNQLLFSCIDAYIALSSTPHLYYGSPPERYNKLLQTVKLSSAGLSQINTVITVADPLIADKLIGQLGLPIVSKILDGSQGDGIEKHDTKDDFKKFLKANAGQSFIFQTFIPNNGDVRAFFIKDQLMFAITRTSVDADEFRNNTSLGGKAAEIELDDQPLKLAKQAAQLMRFDFTGVDLIQHADTKQWYIMEINAAPQFSEERLPDIVSKIIQMIK